MIKLQEEVEDKIKCLLCPNYCILGDKEIGSCRVRTNRNGTIELNSYGIISSMAVEPIEKKPITNYLQGTKTLSLGGISCSLFCPFCENFKISQKGEMEKLNFYSPQKIVEIAKEYSCPSICMTYNEPTISYEFLIDLAEEAHKNDLKFIIKTNGYINDEPWKEICKVVDCVNLDFKGDYDFYYIAGAKRVVILSRIKEAYDLGVHVEISIPLHDDMSFDIIRAFSIFIRKIDKDIPLHLLKIYSAFKHKNTTSDDFINRAKEYLGKYHSNVTLH